MTTRTVQTKQKASETYAHMHNKCECYYNNALTRSCIHFQNVQSLKDEYIYIVSLFCAESSELAHQ